MARDWVKRTVITATAIGIGAFTLTSPAYGFFPPVVSGDGKVSVLKPPVIPPPPPYVIPPVTPPVSPPCVPCACSDEESNQTVTPQGVPEPTTLLSAGLGLAALAGARLRKKSKVT